MKNEELKHSFFMLHFFFRLSERKSCQKERTPAAPAGLLRPSFRLNGRKLASLRQPVVFHACPPSSALRPPVDAGGPCGVGPCLRKPSLAAILQRSSSGDSAFAFSFCIKAKEKVQGVAKIRLLFQLTVMGRWKRRANRQKKRMCQNKKNYSFSFWHTLGKGTVWQEMFLAVT